MTTQERNSVELLYEEMLSFSPPPHRKLCEGLLEQAQEMHRNELDLAYQDGKEIEQIQNAIKQIVKKNEKQP
jgi:hypothetical protein